MNRIKRLLPPVILMFGVVLPPDLIASEATKNPVSAEEVLSEATVARGGREAWLRIHSFHAKGTVYFQTRSGPWWDAPNITNMWPLEVRAMRPNKFWFNTDLKSTQSASTVFVPPRYFENGFDGQTAWEACPGRPPQKLDGIFGVERQELAGFFAWCAEPQNYRSITNLGECDFHGRRCYELEMVRKSGNPERQYYDITNHLLAGIVRSSVFGPSLERFILGDYREFGGFRFPGCIDYQAEDERDWGHVHAVEQLDTIEVNALDESCFRMPGKGLPPNAGAISSAVEVTANEVKSMLRDWVEDDKLADGVVVSLLDEHRSWVAAEGTVARNSTIQPKEMSGDTLFGIASISKVFTRLLMLDMVQRGEMRMDDPAQQYLPFVRFPERNGKQITLLHLATHTSGLPRYFPGSEKEVYAAVSECKLDRDPGEAYEYSNTGMGLLGKAIEYKAGKPYKELVEERICQPLGMKHTTVMNFDFPGIDGIKTSAKDLAKFGAACLGLQRTPPALSVLMQHLYATHGGGGGNGLMNLVVDPIARRALVTLAVFRDGNYSIAYNKLNRLILNQSARPPSTIKSKGAFYDSFLGQYLSDDNSVWVVRRQDRRLLLQQLTGPTCEVYPLSATHFLNQMTGLDATFIREGPSEGLKLVLNEQTSNSSWQGGRISTNAPVRSLIVKLAPEIGGDCSGQYKDPAGHVIVVRDENDQFTAEICSSNPADENLEAIAPCLASSFTSLSGPAAYTFLRNTNGKVTGMIRHFLDSHTRFDKIAPAPQRLLEADADKFLGNWQTLVVVHGQPAIAAVLKISKTNHTYGACVEVPQKGVTNEPLQLVVFLSRSSVFLGSLFEGRGSVFRATLNDSGTELSGTWKEGDDALPIVFKRNNGMPVDARKTE